MIHKLKNLIRLVRVSLITPDDGQYPNAQVSGLGRTSDGITTITPYGLDSKAPLNTIAITLQPFGQEEALVCMPFNPLDANGKTLRVQNLKEGEVAICNVLTGTVIKLAADGNIEVDGKNNVILSVSGSITLNVTGDVNVTAGGATNITSTGACAITSSGATTVKGTSVTVDSSVIELGASASLGVARLNDTVQIIIPPGPAWAGTYTGTITGASTVSKSL